MDTVREIMQTELVTVVPDMSVHDLAGLLADKKISGAPVVDVDGDVLGVVSMTDVIRLAANEVDIRLAPRPLVEGEFSLEAPQEDDYNSAARVLNPVRAAAAPRRPPRSAHRDNRRAPAERLGSAA